MENIEHRGIGLEPLRKPIKRLDFKQVHVPAFALKSSEHVAPGTPGNLPLRRISPAEDSDFHLHLGDPAPQTIVSKTRLSPDLRPEGLA
jgi:hypothetical protein